MSHAVINGDKVVPPCTVSRASAQSEQRGGGAVSSRAEGALVLGYGHGVRGPTVAVRTHAQIAPPCTASRASAQSEERGGRPCKSEGGRRAGRGRARCARRQRSYSTERRGSGRCAWSEGRFFFRDALRWHVLVAFIGWVWGAITSVFGLEGATACENVGQARAGWAGATSHDSDKAPDTLGPRKDAALAD